MLIRSGSDLVEVKAGKSGQNYWSRRLRPHEAGPLGPFETFNEALTAIQATKTENE